MSCYTTILIESSTLFLDQIREMVKGWQDVAERSCHHWEGTPDPDSFESHFCVFRVNWNYADHDRIKADCAKLPITVTVAARGEDSDLPEAIPTGTVIHHWKPKST